MKRFTATLPLLILGICFMAGSVPIFLMKHPIAIFHQSFKNVPSTVEVVAPSTSWIYGALFGGIGLFFILTWLRVFFSRW